MQSLDTELAAEQDRHTVGASGSAGRSEKKQLARYAVVGVANTIFGYCCYAAFVAVYKRTLPAEYRYLLVDLASISATLVGVTVSFLTYKFLVFRTRGNYLREWLRCLLVYGAATIPGLFVLPPLTRLLQRWPAVHNISPYLAGALVMGGTAIGTYLAHSRFSFAPRKQQAEELPTATRPAATSGARPGTTSVTTRPAGEESF